MIALKVEDIHDKLVDVHQDISSKLDDMHQDVRAVVVCKQILQQDNSKSLTVDAGPESSQRRRS